MSEFFGGVRVIVGLELRQRVRSVAWYVLLGIVGLLVLIVTVLLWMSLGAFDMHANGVTVFSTIILFVLLVGTLVTPAVSGNAINGDRDDGTLATTQVTQVTAVQIVLGKFFAAWITALSFLAVTIPFLFIAVLIGGVSLSNVLVSIPVLAAELGIVAAIGVGLSGMLQRPLFSVVVTYLVVAALSVGTLITFGLSTLAFRAEVTHTSIAIDWDASEYDEETGGYTGDIVCAEPSVSTYEMTRTDLTWWLLAANPYVVVADAAPPTFDPAGYAYDPFTTLSVWVRDLQVPPDTDRFSDYCAEYYQRYVESEDDTMEERYNTTVPSWFVGLAIHAALASVALWGATRAIRTPAKKLAKGNRIA